MHQQSVESVTGIARLTVNTTHQYTDDTIPLTEYQQMSQA